MRTHSRSPAGWRIRLLLRLLATVDPTDVERRDSHRFSLGDSVGGGEEDDGIDLQCFGDFREAVERDAFVASKCAGECWSAHTAEIREAREGHPAFCAQSSDVERHALPKIRGIHPRTVPTARSSLVPYPVRLGSLQAVPYRVRLLDER